MALDDTSVVMAIPVSRRISIQSDLAMARRAGTESAWRGDYVTLRKALDREADLLDELVRLMSRAKTIAKKR